MRSNYNAQIRLTYNFLAHCPEQERLVWQLIESIVAVSAITVGASNNEPVADSCASKQVLTSNHHSQEIQDSPQNVTRVSLVLLLLCSSFFALYNSNTAYTSDEVWSIKAASLNSSAEMAALKADVHPPLYFLILHAWIRLFGTGERAVRSLSGLL